MIPIPMITCLHPDCPMNGLHHTGSKRFDEKQLQRRQDEQDLKNKIITPKQMRERNGYFAVDATLLNLTEIEF